MPSRFRRSLPPINSAKHLVQFTGGAASVAAAAAVVYELVEAVHVVDKNLAKEVEAGSVIKAVFIELWLYNDTDTEGNFIVTIEKASGDAPDPTFTNLTILNGYLNKKNILYTTEGLSSTNKGSPIPVIRSWVKIPKGKQRFGLGDKLKLSLASQTGGAVHCGIAIYKEYN